jgi:hypothetical protein
VRLARLFPVNGKDIATGFALRLPFFFGLDRVLRPLSEGTEFRPEHGPRLDGKPTPLFGQGGGDQLVMGILGLGQPGRALCGVLVEGREIARLEQFPRTPRAGERGGGVVNDLRDAVIALVDDRGNAHASPAESVVRRKLCAPA